MFGRGAAAWRGSYASSNFRVWMGIRTVSLEVLLGGSDELDGDELVAERESNVSRVSVLVKDLNKEGGSLPALLESLDDGTNEATLETVLVLAER